MFCVGSLYLVFETRILAPSSNVRSSQNTAPTGLSRALLGIQIGLVVLAMAVTQGSIASLQAKRGLPLGNQVMGWLILGVS